MSNRSMRLEYAGKLGSLTHTHSTQAPVCANSTLLHELGGAHVTNLGNSLEESSYRHSAPFWVLGQSLKHMAWIQLPTSKLGTQVRKGCALTSGRTQRLSALLSSTNGRHT
jgi:hypothetical protein